MTYCITGNYRLDGLPVFDSLSDHVKDLIQGLLSVDPIDRYSLDQIKNHPWLKRNRTSSTKLSLSSFKELNSGSFTELR
jgi:serine/threonine protein kinase